MNNLNYLKGAVISDFYTTECLYVLLYYILYYMLDINSYNYGAKIAMVRRLQFMKYF